MWYLSKPKFSISTEPIGHNYSTQHDCRPHEKRSPENLECVFVTVVNVWLLPRTILSQQSIKMEHSSMPSLPQDALPSHTYLVLPVAAGGVEDPILLRLLFHPAPTPPYSYIRFTFPFTFTIVPLMTLHLYIMNRSICWNLNGP